MKYSERYVAFVDVLGFSELITRSATDESLRENLLGALDFISIVVRGKGGRSSAKTQFLSDCAIIVDQCDPPGLLSVLLGVEHIARALLREFHVFTRGAIVRGEIYFENDVCFGPAILEAVRLEKEASVPKIHLTADVAGQWKKLLREEPPSEKGWDDFFDLVCFEQDGAAYLNVLSLFKTAHRKRAGADYLPGWSLEERRRASSEIGQFLQSSLREMHERPEPLKKLVWFAEYFNRQMEKEGLPRVSLEAG